MGLRSWWRGRQQGASWQQPAVAPAATEPQTAEAAAEDPLVEQIRRAFPDADVTVAHQTVELVGDGEEADELRAALEAAGFATTGEGGEGDDPATQLERLAALHRQGVLTDAEFSAAKARVVGG
jgi:hypothetical protein